MGQPPRDAKARPDPDVLGEVQEPPAARRPPRSSPDVDALLSGYLLDTPAPKPTVLIVEDDEDIRDTLQDVIEDAGYETVTVANGRLALEHVRAAPRPPTLMLLDLMMPTLDGWQVLAQLQRSGYPLSKVVVLTACTKTYLPPEVEVLHKPIPLAVVLDAVRARCPQARAS